MDRQSGAVREIKEKVKKMEKRRQRGSDKA